MKKTVYMAPAINVALAEEEEMICASILEVGGDAGIKLGDGEAPAKADSRFNLWDDDED